MQIQEKSQELLVELEELMQNDIEYFTPKMQREVAIRIYQLESKFSTYREKLELVPIDGKFYSQSILNSFFEEKEVSLFFNEVKAKNRTYWRPKDYQYSILGFLLAFQYQIYGKKLHEVIQLYLQEFKNNLSYGDIEMTSSGRTRCDTNIRFAFKALQEMGLVQEYIDLDDKGEKTWSLTLLGLLVTVSFLHSPAIYEEKKLIFDNKLFSIDKVTPFGSLDVRIIERIANLASKSFLSHLLNPTKSMLAYHISIKEHYELFEDALEMFQEHKQQYDSLSLTKSKSNKANYSLMEIVNKYELKIDYNSYRYDLRMYVEEFYNNIWKSINIQ
jgi:hypothetical protein